MFIRSNKLLKELLSVAEEPLLNIINFISKSCPKTVQAAS